MRRSTIAENRCVSLGVSRVAKFIVRNALAVEIEQIHRPVWTVSRANGPKPQICSGQKLILARLGRFVADASLNQSRNDVFMHDVDRRLADKAGVLVTHRPCASLITNKARRN